MRSCNIINTIVQIACFSARIMYKLGRLREATCETSALLSRFVPRSPRDARLGAKVTIHTSDNYRMFTVMRRELSRAHHDQSSQYLTYGPQRQDNIAKADNASSFQPNSDQTIANLGLVSYRNHPFAYRSSPSCLHPMAPGKLHATLHR